MEWGIILIILVNIKQVGVGAKGFWRIIKLSFPLPNTAKTSIYYKVNIGMCQDEEKKQGKAEDCSKEG